MVVGSPPFQVGEQAWRLLCRGPGATRQRCHRVSDRQIPAFNKSRVQPPRKTQSLSAGCESLLCAQTHHVRDFDELTPPVAFFHLAVDQARRHLPPEDFAPSTSHVAPLPKMSGEAHKNRDASQHS